MILQNILILAIGYFGIVAQVSLMRILQQVFYGNELSYGITLALWLSITGLGAHSAACLHGRFSPRTTQSIFITAILIHTVLLPLISCALFFSRAIAHYLPGEIVTATFMIIVSVIGIAGNAFLQGSLFSLACSVTRTTYTEAYRINRTYIGESIGACVGGITYALFLSPHLSHFSIISITSVTLLAIAATYSWKHSQKIITLATLCALALACIITYITPAIDTLTTHQFYSPFSVADTIHTRYGQSVITQHDTDTFALFENGTLIDETHNDLAGEQHVVLALAQFPTPTPRTLILGDGILSTIPTLKRLGVSDITLVTPNRRQVQFLRDTIAIPETTTITYSHPRTFVKNAPTQYDLIIIATTPPAMLHTNRFYTHEFFSELTTILSPEGVVTFSTPSSENIISAELARFLKSLKLTCETVFSQTILFPGHRATFILSNREQRLLTSPQVISERITQFHTRPRFLNEDYLPYTISPERTHYLSEIIQSTSAGINTDLTPRSFFYFITYISERTSRQIKHLYTLCLYYRTHIIFIVLALYASVLLWLFYRKRTTHTHALSHAILTLGFTEISLEIILILTYQSFFGYVHTTIAALIACYMGGLILGSSAVNYYHAKGYRLPSWIVRAVSASMAIYCSGIALYLAHHHALTSLWKSPVWFFVIMIDIGCIGGIQFAVANIHHTHKKHGSSLYSLDMIGSAGGALITTLILIPLYGSIHTIAFLATLNVWSALFLWQKGKTQTRIR